MCEISQGQDGSITMSMMRYTERAMLLKLSPARRKGVSDRALEVELKAYRTIAGTFLCLGNAVLPQETYVTSLLHPVRNGMRGRPDTDV